MTNTIQTLMIGQPKDALDAIEQTNIDFVKPEVFATFSIQQQYEIVVLGYDLKDKQIINLIRQIRQSSLEDIAVVVLRDSVSDSLAQHIFNCNHCDIISGDINPMMCLKRLENMAVITRLNNEKEKLQYHNHRQSQEFDDAQLDIIIRLGKASEYRDEDSGRHILRVGCYARHIAEKLGMEADFSDMLFLAAPLHDIGKIGVPDKILLKPGKLDEYEIKIMQRHCEIGVEILKHEPVGLEPFLKWQNKRISSNFSKNPLLEMASQIAISHHEKWDGSGYPKGLKGTEIPITGRITAIADVYDALRSHRPYKPGFSQEKALDIIFRQSPGHFDPMILDAFSGMVETFDAINNLFGDAANNSAATFAR